MTIRLGRQGFTLIELIVGLSLLCMLLGFGAINLRHSQGAGTTRAVAELLAESLRQAREEAVKERAPTAVVIPSQAGAKPHSQAFYRLRGAQFPRIQSVRQLGDEFSGVMLFVGHWPLVSGANSASPPPLGGSRRLDFSAWQPPHPDDHHFIFTPDGEVVTNDKVLFDGAYHIVVCRGAEFGAAESVPPAQSFRASHLGGACTVSISLMGEVSVTTGVVGAQPGIGVPDAPWPAQPPALPPVLSVTPNLNPTIEALDVTPLPYPATLPAGIDATVDLKGYLTIKTRAQDPNGGPLRCVWGVDDGGAFSSTVETPMEWDGTEWTSVWEWRPPETAVAGDLFELSCTVKDPTGATDQDLLGAAGVVQVTGVGEILFDSTRDGNREIFAMNEDGTNLVNLTNHPALDHMASWSPDGGRIAFVSNRTAGAIHAVYVMYADGTGVKQVSVPGPYNLVLPEWSPDGTRIAYSESGSGAYPTPRTWVVNADGTGGSVLETHGPPPSSFMRAAWHPSGNFLCIDTFDGATGGGFDISLLATDGSGLGTNLTDLDGFDAMPRWSPDGNSLVWNSDRGGPPAVHNIWVADWDGTGLVNLVQVTNSPDADLQPCWSPDSQRILFVRKIGGPMSGVGDIWMVNRDGTNERQLTTHASLDDFPSWRH